MNGKMVAAFMAGVLLTGGCSVGYQMFGQSITAKSEQDDLQYAFNEDGTIMVKTCSPNAVNVEIPASVDGVAVTRIGEKAFYGCREIEHVTIPDSIVSIGDSAFNGCESLVSISIPNSVEAIGVKVFGSCHKLETVVLPDKMTAIPNSMFSSCFSLQKITIPDSVTTIEYGAFSECTSLTEVIIPENVTTFLSATFDKCTKLKTVYLPKSVTTIGSNSFSNCPEIADVYYAGTRLEFIAIEMGYYNEPLTSANIHYNATASDVEAPTAPTTEPPTEPVTDPSTEPTYAYGDLNHDGFINASDAAIILMYSAKVGTGYTGTLEEYLGQHRTKSG